jgi:hypothetical protein
LVKAKAVGNLLNRRVPEYDVAPADDHRHIRSGHVKAIEQTLDIGVTVKVNVCVGMPVSCQELFDAKRA